MSASYLNAATLISSPNNAYKVNNVTSIWNGLPSNSYDSIVYIFSDNLFL